MARRRDRAGADAASAPVMPRELLEPRNRAVRKEWYAHFGLTTFAAQDEATQRAYAAYGLDANGRDPDAPDPRDLLRDLT